MPFRLIIKRSIYVDEASIVYFCFPLLASGDLSSKRWLPEGRWLGEIGDVEVGKATCDEHWGFM